MLVKAAGAQKRNSAADDFLLRGRFARESWRAGAADTGRDKAEEGGIPAAVFRPTTTQDVPASVRLRACASRASRPVFLSRKKRKGGRFLFLKKRNKRHCGEGCFSEKKRFPVRPARNKKTDGSHTNRPFCVACSRKRQQQRRATVPQMTFFCVVGLHGKAGAQARRTRAETRRRREAYPLRYSDRRQRRMCLRPSV